MDMEEVGDVHGSGGEVSWKRRRNVWCLESKRKLIET
jgi:hypothetical protein